MSLPMRSLPLLVPPLFAVSCLAVFYLTGHDLRIGLLHADALYLPTLFDDLLRHGGRLSDWWLTPAPYFFPDFPLYLLAYLLAPDSYYRILAFAMLQCALLSGLALGLGRQLHIAAAPAAAAFAIVALAGLALTGQEPFVLVASSASHFGAFASGILLVQLWARREDADSRLLRWTAWLLAFATTLSDSLFMLQAALPLAATGMLRVLVDRDFLAGRRRRLLDPGSVLLASWLGHMGYKALVMNRTRYKALMDVRHIGANLRDLGAIVGKLWDAAPLFVLCWLALFAFAAACLVRLVLERGRAPFGLPLRLAWLLVFWLVSTAGAVAASLLVHNIPIAARYFIPAACWAIILAPLVAASLAGVAAGRRALVGAMLGCCATSGAAAWRQADTHPLQTVYYPADLACVDRAVAARGLQRGIAQYWDAKPFQHFSRTGIVLAQHDETLQESHWITSKRYFAPSYDFALVGPRAPSPYNIAPERLAMLNGPPAAQAACGAYTVLLYGHGALKLD